MKTFVTTALIVAFGYLLVRMLVTGEFHSSYQRKTRKEVPVSFWITWAFLTVCYLVGAAVCLRLVMN